MGWTVCSIWCGWHNKINLLLPGSCIHQTHTGGGSWAEIQLCVNSHTHWAYDPHVSLWPCCPSCSPNTGRCPDSLNSALHCSVVGVWKDSGRAMPRNKMGKHLFTLLSFASWNHVYGNNLPNSLPSVSRMPFSGSHKSVQCSSTSVNNKWRTIIEYLAKNLSVSPGRTLMGGGGVQFRGTSVRRKCLTQACLSSSSSCCKSLQGYLKFLGLLQLEMVVPPNYLKLKVQNKSQCSVWKLKYRCCIYISVGL